VSSLADLSVDVICGGKSEVLVEVLLCCRGVWVALAIDDGSSLSRASLGWMTKVKNE
jgi:hypothetical protein